MQDKLHNIHVIGYNFLRYFEHSMLAKSQGPLYCRPLSFEIYI